MKFKQIAKSTNLPNKIYLVVNLKLKIVFCKAEYLRRNKQFVVYYFDLCRKITLAFHLTPTSKKSKAPNVSKYEYWTLM